MQGLATVGTGRVQRSRRSKYWMVTLNNPTVLDRETWRNYAEGGSLRIQYFVYQEEQGEAETIHFQGYIQFRAVTRMSGVKTMLGHRVHCDASRGTPEQASAYCQKEESRVALGDAGEWGELFTPSKDKLVNALQAIRDGSTPSEVMEDFPVAYVRNRDGIQDYHLSLKEARRWAMEVQIFVGPTRSGKSATADAENPGAYYVPWPTGGRWWWPGYVGQPTVIMDEFRMQIKMDVMLKMLDRYNWTLEAKGRNFQFVSTKIVLTTNIDPKDWYAGVPLETREPLEARIREFCTIYDFTPGRQFGQFEKVARTELFSFTGDGDQGGGMMDVEYDERGYRL